MQESRRRRRLELCVLSLTGLLAACIHLPSSNTPPAVAAEPPHAADAEPPHAAEANVAPVDVSSSSSDRGLSACSIGLGNAFAVRAQSVRALPELKPPRLEPWATLLPPVEDSDTEIAVDEPSST